MKKLITLLFAVLLVNCSFAQSINDYRTISSGNWSDMSIWQTYNGVSWMPAIAAPDYNDSTITIQGGNTVMLDINYTLDQVIVASGATLVFANVSLMLNDGPGDDVIVNGTLNMPAGAIMGSGTISINSGGTYSWSGGTLEGVIITNANAGSTFNISGTSVKNIYGSHQLNNYTICNWMGIGNIDFYNSSSINNYGILNINTDADFTDCCSPDNTLSNMAGATINKTGSDTTVINNIYFSNFGTLNILSGSIETKTLCNFNGATIISAGANLTFWGNSTTFNAGATIGGGGLLNIAGGNGCTFNSNITTSTNTVNLSNGFFQGDSTFNINNGSTFNWINGIMKGNGITNMNAGSVFTISDTALKGIYDSRVLNNNTTCNWSGTGNIDMYGNSQINNYSIWNINTDADFTDPLSNQNQINNEPSGSFNKWGSGQTFLAPNITFNNYGTVNVNNGNLNLTNNTGTHSGTYNVVSGATLSGSTQMQFTGNTFTNNGSVTLKTLAFTGSTTQSLNGTGSIDTLMMNGGGGVMLGGTQTINYSFNPSYGKLYMGNYDIIIGPNASVSAGNPSSYLVTDGTGTCKRNVPNTVTDVLFPVGIPICYMPATINLTASSTADLFSVRMLDSIYSSYDASYNPTALAVTNHTVNGTWLISEGTAGGSNATVTLQWNAVDEGSNLNHSAVKLVHYTGGLWDNGPQGAAVGTDPYIYTRTNISSFSPFGVIDTIASLNPTGCTFYRDADQDGYGNPLVDTIVASCILPVGWVTNNLDCDDNNAYKHPGPEACGNGIDDNCNGLIDESTAIYLSFSGSSSNVLTAYQSNLLFNATNSAFTAACWFKADSAKSIWNSYLIDKHDSVNGGSGFVLREGTGIYPNGTLLFSLYDSTHVEHHVVAGTVYQGQWNYAVAMYDGFNTMSLYLNGLLIGTATATSIQPSNSNITFGGGTDSVTNTFPGGIDNVSIWDHTISQANIIAAMSSDSLGSNGNIIFYNFDNTIATPGGANADAPTAYNFNAGYDGILTNFALTGLTSNYEIDNLAWYMDNDGDGYVVGAPVYSCANPGAGYIYTGILGNDCNDNNPNQHSPSHTTITHTICTGQSVTVGTHTYTTTGVYIDTVAGYSTCDSILTTNLTVGDTLRVTQNKSQCSGKSLTVGIHQYFNAGTYLDTLIAIGGCDSIVTTNLTVNPPLSIHNVTDSTMCKYDTAKLKAIAIGGVQPYNFIWHVGTTTINNDSVFVHPLTNTTYTVSVTDGSALSCYEVMVVDLTVHQQTQVSGYVTSATNPVTHGYAELYDWQNHYIHFDSFPHLFALDASGYFHFDTIPHGKYILEVFPDNSFYPAQHLIPTYFDSTGSVAIWDNATVINHGCISNSDSLNVSMFAEDTTSTGILGTLAGYVIQGQHYYHNPTQPVTGVDVKLGHGGGGIIVHSTTTDTTGHYQFNNIPLGTYTVMVDIPGLQRDSIYTVNVTATQYNFNYLDYIADSADIYMHGCVVPHEIISQPTNYFTVSSLSGNITYQWLDCSTGYSVISGADSSWFMPSLITDSYAVYVTQNGCIDTSNCLFYLPEGITGNNEDTDFTIFPNPFNAQTTISFSSEQKNTVIKITNVLGEEIRAINFSGKQFILDKGTMNAGVYFINVQNKQGSSNKKIVIQ